MKFKWRGRFKEITDLPKGKLPINAKKFKEPTSLFKFNLLACLTLIPVILILMLLNRFKTGHGFINPYDGFHTWGMIGAVICIIVHELIHGLAFPKGVIVDFWYSPKNLMAFVHSTYPMTKKRFIWMSLLPTLILGGIPYVIWFVLPYHHFASHFIFTFAFFSILMGGGDFINVINAMIQMPKGTYTQISGFHSYWFEQVPIEERSY